jgi:hypothetical protein
MWSSLLSATIGHRFVRLILDSNPRVVNPGEFSFLFEFVIDDAQLPDVN